MPFLPTSPTVEMQLEDEKGGSPIIQTQLPNLSTEKTLHKKPLSTI